MPTERKAFVAIGKKIRQFRKQRTWTQVELAEKAQIDLVTLQDAEKGRRNTSLKTIRKLANTLRIPPETLTGADTSQNHFGNVQREPLFPDGDETNSSQQLDLIDTDMDANEANALATLLIDSSAINNSMIERVVHEWLVAPPPQKVELTSGRRIGEGLVSKVEKRVIQLRLMDDYFGGRDLLAIVEREMALTSQLLRDAAFSDLLGRRLLIAIGELCQLASWVAVDAGADTKAAQYIGIGVKAAHLADDRAVAANLISTHAYNLTNTGNLKDGILFAQSAIHGVGAEASATTTALFRERLAWAYACAGQQRPSELTLAAVDRDFSRAKPEEDPEWVYWMNADEIDVMAARCFVKLNQPKRSIDRLSRVVERYDQQKAREVALYTSWLSEAHIIDRNIEEAAHPHVHCIINRVDPNDGRMAVLSKDRERLSKWAHGYERERGPLLTPKRAERYGPEAERQRNQQERAQDMAEQTPRAMLGQLDAAQRERHKQEWQQLGETYRTGRKAILERHASPKAIIAEHRKERRTAETALRENQAKEMAAFSARSRSLFGRLKNALNHAMEIRPPEQGRFGFMKAVARFTFAPAKIRQHLADKHKAHRDALSREGKTQLTEKIASMKQARQLEFTGLTKRFEKDRETLIARQDAEKAKMKEAWRAAPQPERGKRRAKSPTKDGLDHERNRENKTPERKSRTRNRRPRNRDRGRGR